MKNWLCRINKWKFDRKMSFLLSVAVAGTSLIILLISTVSMVISMSDKTQEMIEDQLSTLASNYEDALTGYKTLAYALIMDSSVQDYLHCDTKSDKAYFAASEGAYNAMSNMVNMQENINFIAVRNYAIDDYLYKGRENLSVTLFDESFPKDYENSRPATSAGVMTLNFSNSYYKGEQYTLNVYHPMYSITKMVQERGLMVMSINDNLLEQLYRRESNIVSSEVFMTDIEGTIVSTSDRSKIKSRLEYADRIKGGTGSFLSGTRKVVYHRVEGWNYYLVYTVPMLEMYRDIIGILILLVIMILVMAALSISFSRKVISRSYQPLDMVVSEMDRVARGELDARVDARNVGEDFEKLTNGFNSMMDEILVLMEQVKLEQHQVEQIRFNALQAQIQPHFLYNSLECIHWQAMADGNKEISTLVKALAKYYRICLSRGKDVILLSQELEHIRAYMTIQNMRYDNIIESDIRVGEEFMDVQIPKMTLQPLVENSIYHGIRVKEGQKGTVHITAKRNENDVYVMVADSGSGMSEEQIAEMNASISVYDDSFGYGVRNVNKRIEIMFGEEYGLMYYKNSQGGVTVEIHLPMEAEIDYEEVL